jgi:hypothetical protein
MSACCPSVSRRICDQICLYKGNIFRIYLCELDAKTRV